MFEVGDKVISDYFGEGKVIEVNTKLDYPVTKGYHEKV